ncbi:MAG: hypothetical protein WBM12_01990, partial [Pseudolabrys sp.]
TQLMRSEWIDNLAGGLADQSDLPLEHARSGVMSACYHFATQLDSTRQNWAGQRDRLRRENQRLSDVLGRAMTA